MKAARTTIEAALVLPGDEVRMPGGWHDVVRTASTLRSGNVLLEFQGGADKVFARIDRITITTRQAPPSVLTSRPLSVAGTRW